MSDFSPTSSFAAPEAQPASAFDVTSIDKNLRSISAVEQRWRLPALPDSVKLDLATAPGVNEVGVQSFLQGLDSDLMTQEEELEEDPAAGLRTDFRDPEFGTSRFDQIRVQLAGIAGEPEPTAPTVDAVQRFKLDAIERGLLERPADGSVDSRWSPELNRIRSQMAYDDYNERLRGDRPGAVPTNRVLSLLDKWTSPSGLLAAATELDLWWDTGAVSDEWNSWGDKWRKLSESKNPLDFGKNLIDAVTGPIDDVVFPIANMALMMTGVGSITNGARIGWMAARGGAVGTALRGLYLAADVGSTRNLARLGEASWTATKLLRSENAVAKAAGGGMAAWRAFEPVKRAKSVSQLGMRAGMLSQAQDLMPGYRGGLSIADASPDVEAAAGQLRAFGHNPAALPLEIMVAPFNIWTPGTFFARGGEGLGLASKTAEQIGRSLGTIGGRAVVGGVTGAGLGVLGGDPEDVLEGATIGALGGALLPYIGRGMSTVGGRVATGGVLGAAIGGTVATVMDDGDLSDGLMLGAVAGVGVVGRNSVWSHFTGRDDKGLSKFIGHAGDFLSRFSYKPITDDQRVASTFHQALMGTLQGEELTRYRTKFEETNSFRAAFADHLGVDEETAAAAVSYVMVAAAIDHTADVQAKVLGTEGYWDRFHMARNKLISQLRSFDVSGAPGRQLMDDIARSAVIDKARTVKQFNERWARVREGLTPEKAAELAQQHNETAAGTLNQLLSAENMPELAQVPGWSELDVENRMGVLSTYLPKVLDTFGNWPSFVARSSDLRHMIDAGDLADARFLPGVNRFGYEVNPGVEQVRIKDTMLEADDAIIDQVVANPTAARKTYGRFSVLARVQPSGKFTVMGADKMTKQQVLRRADELQGVLEAKAQLDRIEISGDLARVRAAAGADINIDDVDRETLKDLVRVAGASKRTKSFRYLQTYAKHHGLSWDDLRTQIDTELDRLANDADLWEAYGLDRFVKGPDGALLRGQAALEQRYKALKQRAKFTAAEIDLDSIIESVRVTKGDTAADDVAAQLRAMEDDGYKLVHGVEYMMPHDLAHGPMFADIGRRQMNSVTMGNFFGRKLPVEARLVQERRQRTALAEALARRAPRLEDADLDAEGNLISNIMKDLYEHVLLPKQEKVMSQVEDLASLNFWAKKRIAAESTFTPVRIEDLQAHGKEVTERLLELGYERDVVDAVVSALPQFRNADFKDLGLYSFEAKLRQRNELVSGLKFLSGTKYGEGIWSRGTLGRRVGAAGGFYQGTASADPDASMEERLGRGIVGAAVGAAAGTIAVGGASKVAAGAIDNAVSRAELMRTGHLGDKYARLRDALRFSLSPIFDISRYTEGAMLAHTAVPARLSSGERIVLPGNMSPSGFRRRLAKEARATGLTADEARRRAASQFKSYRREWVDATRGHFDPDVLDSTGHWFTQIGIMGFNPTDWQASLFMELRRQGMGAEDAWRHTRETYTYGTRGRSAAELSVNFVFFPFSFQKKAFGHIAKWMNDDLGRSLIIHDAMKTYEILDQEYDLNQVWRDRLPAIQQFNRLNLLAFGVSPGRFGGMNAQLFESTFRGAMGLFMPSGVSIKDAAEAAELQKLVRSLTPALNDINWMVKNLKEQGHVAFSDSHLTTVAQTREAYGEWNEYRDQLGQQLEDKGYSWSDLHNKPYLEEAKIAYELKRAELGDKYPSWSQARQESIFNIQALAMEKDDRLAKALGDPTSASAEDLLLLEFEAEVQKVKQRLSLQGVTVDGPDGWLDAPLWAPEYLIERSVRMSRENPAWRTLYGKFYERELGPLEAKLGS
jgi:hypothetical protein